VKKGLSSFLFYPALCGHTYGQEVRTGVTNWDLLRPYLPAAWVEALAGLPPSVGAAIQEVRLRADQPITVSFPWGEGYLCVGGVSSLRQPDGFFCSAACLEDCFLAFCGHSVYAHQWELAQGYVAVAGGIRVGVAGTAVTRDGQVCAVRQVTALCVRLPRRVAGCARPLLPLLLEEGRPVSTLLVGPPACGKTTLLRDAAALLSARRHRVAVVDERGELSTEAALAGCDVLKGYPKAVGVRQAVRCLAPDCILLDELGDGAEMQAVADCAHGGVAVIASLHGYSPRQMGEQPFVRELIRRRVFGRWVFLQGREAPGRIRACTIPEVTPYGVDWRIVVAGGGDGDGAVCGPSSAAESDLFGDLRTAAAGAVAGDELYRPADDRPMAAVGAE